MKFSYKKELRVTVALPLLLLLLDPLSPPVTLLPLHSTESPLLYN